jgi:hypothetical protein
MDNLASVRFTLGPALEAADLEEAAARVETVLRRRA